MPRCKKQRCCRILENERVFKPTGIPLSELEIIEIEIDEFEAIRLCDYEGKSQIETAEIMLVSRGTVQRILNFWKEKNTRCFITSKSYKIKKYRRW